MYNVWRDGCLLYVSALILLTIISEISSELTQQACYPDPRKINQTILCPLNKKIDILTISVGFSEQSCDYNYCHLQEVNETNEYFLFVEDECKDKHSCMLSSVILFKNYSFSTFDICSHAGKSRNSVKLDYECVLANADEITYNLAPTFSRTAPGWTTEANSPSITSYSSPRDVTTPKPTNPPEDPVPDAGTVEGISDGDIPESTRDSSHTDRVLTQVVAPLLGALLALSIVILVVCIVRTKRESDSARRFEDDDIEIKFTSRTSMNSSHNNSNTDFDDLVTIEKRRSLQRIEELSEADSCSCTDLPARKRRYSNSNLSTSAPHQENASWSCRPKAGSPGLCSASSPGACSAGRASPPGVRGDMEFVTLPMGRRLSVSEQEDSGIAEVGSSMCSSCSSTNNRPSDQELHPINKLPADELPDYGPQPPQSPRENGLITKSDLYQAIKDAVQDKYPETKRNTRCNLTRIAE